MKISRQFEFPPDLQPLFEKSKKLEKITIAYLISVVIVMYLTMGSSQAMKTAWIEDILSLIPAIVFLISSKIYYNKANEEHPYGYHRIVTISFLTGSVALFSMGAYLLIESVMKLVTAEHPTIGSVEIFGNTIWQGWLMIIALLYSAVPAVFLGKMKLPLANKLHDKILFTDAKMNFADWKTAAAAIVGITGIAFGLWWMDSAAAIVISTDILYDGFSNLKNSIMDLMDREPKTIEGNRRDPVLSKVKKAVKEEDWVKEFELRMREEGHVYFGDIIIVPVDEKNIISRIKNLTEKIHNISWRLFDIVIMPVKEIPEEQKI